MFFEMVSHIATIEPLHIAQPELAPEFARQNLKISSLHLTFMQRASKAGRGDLTLSASVWQTSSPPSITKGQELKRGFKAFYRQRYYLDLER